MLAIFGEFAIGVAFVVVAAVLLFIGLPSMVKVRAFYDLMLHWFYIRLSS